MTENFNYRYRNYRICFNKVIKCLIRLPTHPIVTILREYVKDRLIVTKDSCHNLSIYCDHVYFLLKNNDCIMMEDFHYKYKSCRKCFNKVIKSLNEEGDTRV